MKEFPQIGRHKTAVRINANGELEVQYHQTVVFQRTKVGDIILRTGGYKTATTKKRINQSFSALGFPAVGIFQKDFEWFVRLPGNHTVPFRDGIQITADQLL